MSKTKKIIREMRRRKREMRKRKREMRKRKREMRRRKLKRVGDGEGEGKRNNGHID